MNLKMAYDTLFWGRFLDRCDSTLNYKAFHFFYSMLVKIEALRMSVVKRRRWNTPVILGDYYTKRELEKISKIASLGLIDW